MVLSDGTFIKNINDYDTVPSLEEMVIVDNKEYKIVKIVNDYDDSTIKFVLE